MIGMIAHFIWVLNMTTTIRTMMMKCQKRWISQLMANFPKSFLKRDEKAKSHQGWEHFSNKNCRYPPIASKLWTSSRRVKLKILLSMNHLLKQTRSCKCCLRSKTLGRCLQKCLARPNQLQKKCWAKELKNKLKLRKLMSFLKYLLLKSLLRKFKRLNNVIKTFKFRFKIPMQTKCFPSAKKRLKQQTKIRTTCCRGRTC